jgi:tagatose 6-phosphate kinase
MTAGPAPQTPPVTLVICPNLAVDRVVRVPVLTAGETLRGECLIQQAGGKGGNVVRALAQLGGRGLLGGFAAGHTGRLIAELASDENLEFEFALATGESRVSTVLLEHDGRQSRLFEYGPRIGADDEHALLKLVEDRPAAGAGMWAVVTGSSPPGAAPDFYGRLVTALRDAGYRVLLDAEGEQLRQGLRARPELVKVNLREALSAAGPHAGGPGEGAAQDGSPRDACARLVADGAGAAIVTAGAEGAVALVGGAWSRVTTPAVPVVNTVGSGDCFAAALVLALERGEPAEAALRAAAGTAAANAASELTAHFDRELAARLTAAASVTPLAPA